MKYLSLLKGINVGGHHKIKMADLKQQYADWGFENVQSYIQSGNLTFESSEKAKSVQTNIENGIIKEYGFDISVFIFSLKEWNAIIDNCPFEINEETINRLYITLLSEKPTKELWNELYDMDKNGDDFQLINQCIYTLYKTKVSESKITNPLFEKKLKLVATSRNWKTTLKLQEMMS